MEEELTMTFKAVIINGKIIAPISKQDWKVEEIEDMYIISPKIIKELEQLS